MLIKYPPLVFLVYEIIIEDGLILIFIKYQWETSGNNKDVHIDKGEGEIIEDDNIDK